MTRTSAWQGNWRSNRRPYVTMAPDVYFTLQGETSINRQERSIASKNKSVNFNDYITSISTEASVDSAPGSATIQLTVPDNDINDFYVDGQLILIPMMEVEIYSKGYFLIGGFPQYYKIFWGVISSVTKSWSDGTTTINISCRDILRWWELTNVMVNPAFLNPQAGIGYQLFQNQQAGMNPYATIIQLASEAMGSFSFTTSSFLSYNPEASGEAITTLTGSYMRDMMLYWQLKFGRMWNSLVLYGASGHMYTTLGNGGTLNPNTLAKVIFEQEWEYVKDQSAYNELLKISQSEIATYKRDISRAGDAEFFQNESMTKLALANQAKDQIGYEFFCDPCGDIVFKPPFYNLNVLPNKPVSWVQDFEIIDDSVTDSEAEVYTHITSSGNAFGGVDDWGLNDDITTPRTGAYDYHLLRRYGWRRFDYQCEWAGNPKKLFYHLLDMLDRLNAKRQNGTVTIPLRPELKLGFPIWFPKHDSFYYINAISHAYSVGGQATTTLTLSAKRSKFIAPSNIGTIKAGPETTQTVQRSQKTESGKTGDKNTPAQKKPEPIKQTVRTFITEFPDNTGDTTGLSNLESQGKPVELRDPKTGKLLGFPNVVMVYRTTVSGSQLNKLIETTGQPKDAAKKNTQKQQPENGAFANEDKVKKNVFTIINEQDKQALISRIRLHRYEAGVSNAGAYDYAHDYNRLIKEFQIVPMKSVTQGATKIVTSGSAEAKTFEEERKKLEAEKANAQTAFNQAKGKFTSKDRELTAAKQVLENLKKSKNVSAIDNAKSKITALGGEHVLLKAAMDEAETKVKELSARISQKDVKQDLNMIIRPVSDEFGFEVIGHNRYGRGAYIDRGKLQIPKNESNSTTDTWNSTINQINIQFAPTGGVLTEGVQTNEQSSIDFSRAFEMMRPEDWATGAHFKGSSSNGTDKPSDYLITSVNTYSADIEQNKGRSVYIEADSTRRAITLAELKPTIEIDGLSSSVENSSSGLGRADWLSILPESVIAEILSDPAKTADGVSASSEYVDFRKSYNVSLSDSNTSNNSPNLLEVRPMVDTNGKAIQQQLIVGNINSGTFFTALSKYMSDMFDENLKSNNAREDIYSGKSLGKTFNYNLSDPAYQNTVLSPPGGSLFDRAAQGDPTATDALKNQANFNFGLTNTAAADLKKQYEAGSQLKFESRDRPAFRATTGDPNSPPSTDDPTKQVQPVQPTFKSLVNGRYAASYAPGGPPGGAGPLSG